MDGHQLTQAQAVDIKTRQLADRKTPHRAMLTEEFKNRVVKLWSETDPTITVADLCARLRCSSWTIYRILAERGIPRRRDV